MSSLATGTLDRNSKVLHDAVVEERDVPHDEHDDAHLPTYRSVIETHVFSDPSVEGKIDTIVEEKEEYSSISIDDEDEKPILSDTDDPLALVPQTGPISRSLISSDGPSVSTNSDPQRSANESQRSGTESRAFSQASTVLAGNTVNQNARRETEADALASSASPMDEKSVMKCFRNIPTTCPRLYWLVFGLVVPMLILICISLFFGYFLSLFESGLEMESNNQVIARQSQAERIIDFLNKTSVVLPAVCVNLYFRNISIEEDDVYFHLFPIYKSADSAQNVINARFTEFNDTNGVNAPDADIFHFMNSCTEKGRARAEAFIGEQYLNVDINGGLSFNWIRCDPDGETTGEESIFRTIFGSIDSSSVPLDIAAHVVDEWTKDQHRLEEEYLKEWNSTSMNATEYLYYRRDAYMRSAAEADGFANCTASSVSGAWFWFTIMTTIGYGNAAPQTFEGRVMVFTVGFVSMLVFGFVLGNAGKVVTTIIDELLDKIPHSTFGLRNLLLCLLWGVFYYAWMLCVAWATIDWKEQRVSVELEWDDAYWFAFISTTTIGLGDFFLEHHALRHVDLINFSLLMLLGFIFLSTFLVKLGEVMTAFHTWKGGRKCSKGTDSNDRREESITL